MEITFKIVESFEDILSQIENGTDFFNSLCRGENPNRWVEYWLSDPEMDMDSYAKAWKDVFSDTIDIETAFSGFKYRIYDRGYGTFVQYEGAFNGLLAQNLLPKFTPVDLSKCEVKSSLKNCLYEEYVEIHKKFTEFKSAL